MIFGIGELVGIPGKTIDEVAEEINRQLEGNKAS